MPDYVTRGECAYESIAHSPRVYICDTNPSSGCRACTGRHFVGCRNMEHKMRDARGCDIQQELVTVQHPKFIAALRQ